MTATNRGRTRESAKNNLLAALKPADMALVAPHLEFVSLPRGRVLFDVGDLVTQIYFPCDGMIISLIVTADPGHAVETASIGREGAVGGVVSQGFLPAFTRAVVQTEGMAFRLPLAALQAAKATSPALRNLFFRYADCLLSQVLQSVACNALHTIDQRCAKWLLLTRDRLAGERLPLTHESLAQILGVQRSYVSKVLGRLHRQGLIRLNRGRVDLLDVDQLENGACECYGQVKRHFERVLSGVYPDADVPKSA